MTAPIEPSSGNDPAYGEEPDLVIIEIDSDEDD